MAKSMRNAFIRLSAVNNTQEEGRVVYTKEQVKKKLDDWDTEYKIKYWGIEHTPDDEDPNDHFHFAIRFKVPTPFANIKSKFPYGHIDSIKFGEKQTIQYLIHMNDQSKKQYKWEEVFTNTPDLSPYKIRTDAQDKVAILPYLEMIRDFDLFPYQVTDKVPWELRIQTKNKALINNAFIDQVERFCVNQTRDMEVMFICGPAGVGKTDYAKSFCESKGFRFCISSSSNDPLQDYKGEPVLILDDFTDDSFNYKDFMKLLDNNTRSSSKSRYKNKVFMGDLIIITTTRNIDAWYFAETSHEKHEMRRRIKTMVMMDKDWMTLFEYDKETFIYVRLGRIRNVYNMHDPVEKLSLAHAVMDAMGVEFELDPKLRNSKINDNVEENREKIDKSFSEVGENRRRYNGKR